MSASSSSPCPCLKGLCSEIVNSLADFYVQLRLFETRLFIGPRSLLLQEPVSILSQHRWRRMEGGSCHCSCFIVL